jgi:hypothetical protein
MRRALLFAALMSVSFPALAITANMPGDPCPSQFGVTKLSDDKANIVACLQASGTDTALVWKATTSGGGGVTGGCIVTQTTTFIPTMVGGGWTGNGHSEVAYVISNKWGYGCKANGTSVTPSQAGPCAISDSGYVCGFNAAVNATSQSCFCVKQ